MNIRMTMKVIGKVQGVSFRKHTSRMARELGVRGWVMNLNDGSVEGCFEGETTVVESLLSWCSIGPERACVHHLSCDVQPYTGEFQDFRIEREDDMAT